MKKIILLSFILSVIVCCKKTNFDAPESEKSTINAPAKIKSNDCRNLLVVNVNKIPFGTRRNDWQMLYQDGFCDPSLTGIPNNNCGSNREYFDLESINGRMEQARWIKDTRDYFCYIESKYYIENTHRVAGELVENTINKLVNTTFTDFDLTQIKNIIKSSGGDYDTDKYDRYIVVDTTGGTITLSAQMNYDENKNCYSVQNFKSIIAVHGIPGDPAFGFARAPSGSPYVTFFRVKKRSTDDDYLYYDYSDNPGKMNPL